MTLTINFKKQKKKKKIISINYNKKDTWRSDPGQCVDGGQRWWKAERKWDFWWGRRKEKYVG